MFYRRIGVRGILCRGLCCCNWNVWLLMSLFFSANRPGMVGFEVIFPVLSSNFQSVTWVSGFGSPFCGWGLQFAKDWCKTDVGNQRLAAISVCLIQVCMHGPFRLAMTGALVVNIVNMCYCHFCGSSIRLYFWLAWWAASIFRHCRSSDVW